MMPFDIRQTSNGDHFFRPLRRRDLFVRHRFDRIGHDQKTIAQRGIEPIAKLWQKRPDPVEMFQGTLAQAPIHRIWIPSLPVVEILLRDIVQRGKAARFILWFCMTECRDGGRQECDHDIRLSGINVTREPAAKASVLAPPLKMRQARKIEPVFVKHVLQASPKALDTGPVFVARIKIGVNDTFAQRVERFLAAMLVRDKFNRITTIIKRICRVNQDAFGPPAPEGELLNDKTHLCAAHNSLL
nr:hypothetical protein [Celeribacter sp. HF31]